MVILAQKTDYERKQAISLGEKKGKNVLERS